MNGAAALLLSASPRRGGNCDAAVETAAQTLCDAGRASENMALRDYDVLPCISCGHCARNPGATCPRQARDNSAPLLAALTTARERQVQPALVLAAPIYFYHLPAQFKALIDRSQPLWSAREAARAAGRPQEAGPERTAGVILIAARPVGQKLFEGSIVTLRLWLGLLGLTMRDPLTLRGLDESGAFRSDPAAQTAVADYIRALTGI